MIDLNTIKVDIFSLESLNLFENLTANGPAEIPDAPDAPKESPTEEPTPTETPTTPEKAPPAEEPFEKPEQSPDLVPEEAPDGDPGRRYGICELVPDLSSYSFSS